MIFRYLVIDAPDEALIAGPINLDVEQKVAEFSGTYEEFREMLKKYEVSPNNFYIPGESPND